MTGNSYLTVKNLSNKQTKMDLDEDFNVKCKLVEEVEKYPLIYDKAHPYHYNQLKKEVAFQEIGVILQKDGEFHCTTRKILH